MRYKDLTMQERAVLHGYRKFKRVLRSIFDLRCAIALYESRQYVDYIKRNDALTRIADKRK